MTEAGESQELILIGHRSDGRAAAIIRTVLDSENSRRAYERALNDFLKWHKALGQPQLNKAIVQRYATELRERGLSSANINQRLSAIRKLAREAADNGAIDPQLATAASPPLRASSKKDGAPAIGSPVNKRSRCLKRLLLLSSRESATVRCWLCW